MKKKYQRRVDKATESLSNACAETSKLFMEASLDGTIETDFDFIEKDDKLYFDIHFIVPAMNLK